jgi:preprotein translocase subunit SecG
MQGIQSVLLVVHLLIALALIGVILLQRSEGGALGIGGGSGNLFSSRGVGNALTRATALLAACFFATSIALTVFASNRGASLFDSVVPQATTTEAPAKPVDGGTLLPKLDGQPQSAPAQPPKTP